MAVVLPEQPPVIVPKVATKNNFSWANVVTGLTRAEVIFTALAAGLPQVISLANDAALNHVSSSVISAAAVAVFTAFEAIKDGWAGTKS